MLNFGYHKNLGVKSVRPEVRETTDFYGGAYHPSKRLPLTPSRRSSFFAVDGRAETDSFNYQLRGQIAHRFNAV